MPLWYCIGEKVSDGKPGVRAGCLGDTGDLKYQRGLQSALPALTQFTCSREREFLGGVLVLGEAMRGDFVGQLPPTTGYGPPL